MRDTVHHLYCVLTAQLSHDIPADTGLICDKAAVLGDTIEGTPSVTSGYVTDLRGNLPLMLSVMLSENRQAGAHSQILYRLTQNVSA
jgi:hypothetical protein